MPRVYGITIPAGIEIIYNKSLKMYDISVMCNVGKNVHYLTRSQKYTLRGLSKLFEVAYRWSALSQAQKDAWYIAGDPSGMNGYALFTQDTIYRYLNGLIGLATPSIYHQYFIGHVEIEAPATSCLAVEYHDTPLSFPCTMSVNYRSNLVSTGPGSFAKLTFQWLRLFSGKNYNERQSIDFGLVDAWQTKQISITQQPGVIGTWALVLELYNVTGNLYIDNLSVEYDGTIQNVDFECDVFPESFIEEDVGSGVTLESIYCPDAVS